MLEATKYNCVWCEECWVRKLPRLSDAELLDIVQNADEEIDAYKRLSNDALNYRGRGEDFARALANAFEAMTLDLQCALKWRAVCTTELQRRRENADPKN